MQAVVVHPGFLPQTGAFTKKRKATWKIRKFKNKGQVGFRAAPKAGGGTGAPLSQSQEAEARWEFSLAASNLPKAIASDIRRFLRLVS